MLIRGPWSRWHVVHNCRQPNDATDVRWAQWDIAATTVRKERYNPTKSARQAQTQRLD